MERAELVRMLAQVTREADAARNQVGILEARLEALDRLGDGLRAMLEIVPEGEQREHEEPVALEQMSPRL